MKRWSVVVVAIAFCSRPFLHAAEPTIFGSVAALLQPTDRAAIARHARGRALLAVEALRTDAWLETWLALAYLQPESDVRGVRRGRIVELETLVRDKRAQGWRVTSRDGRYAQVAIPDRAFSEQIDDTGLDRPFRVYGKFSDAEIAGLVAYVRSSPQEPPIPDDPDGTSHAPPDKLDGHRPLIQVHRLDRGTAEVLLAYTPRSGQRAVLHYRNGTWHLGGVSLYVV
jgi:hypothetical protein